MALADLLTEPSMLELVSVLRLGHVRCQVLGICGIFSEATKHKTHLELLRKEYVKLQQKYLALENKFQSLVVSSPEESGDTFVSRLLNVVSSLFNNEQYR